MEELRIKIFKHLVYHLKEWYKVLNGIDDQEFIAQNDFSILKIIKLDFLVAAVDSHNDPLLLNNSTYYALPYGPVETSVYDAIRNKNVIGFTFTRYRLEQIDDQLPSIEQSLSDSIKNSIAILKKNKPNLINSDAGTLVEITHEWNSWKKNYSLARKLGLFSHQIPNHEIVNDIKIFNIPVV